MSTATWQGFQLLVGSVPDQRLVRSRIAATNAKDRFGEAVEQGRGHIGVENRVGRSPKARWVVAMIEVRS